MVNDSCAAISSEDAVFVEYTISNRYILAAAGDSSTAVIRFVVDESTAVYD